MGYWGAVCQRARRETLEQIRWDSPVRIMTGIIAPVISGILVWYASGNVAWGGIVTVLLVALIGFCVFAAKLYTLPAAMASERTAEFADLLAKKAPDEAIKRKREGLGSMLAEANGLARAFCSEHPLDELIAAVNNWHLRATEFADESLDTAERSILWSDAGIICGEPTINEERKDRWRWINYRAIRLQQIIGIQPHHPF